MGQPKHHRSRSHRTRRCQPFRAVLDADMTLVPGVARRRHGDAAVSPDQNITRAVVQMWAALSRYLVFGDIPTGWIWAGVLPIVGSGLAIAWPERRPACYRSLSP